jgi:hypothetical protein
MCGSRRNSAPWTGLGLAAWLGLVGCAGLGESVGPTPEQLYGLSLPRVGGGEVRLAEHRGQVLMLDLFVTWSQASALAIPGYAVLQGRYAEQGLVVVGIALDEVALAVEPFVRGYGLPYPVALADDSVRQGRSPLGPVDSLPALLVFDRDGRLRGAFLGRVPLPQVEALIRHLL